MTATFRAQGFVLTLELRNANGETLGPDGVWRVGNHVALRTADTAVAGDGQAGLGRPVGSLGKVQIDEFRALAGQPVSEGFNTIPVGSLPAGWSAWGSDAIARPAASSSRAVQVSGPSGASGRAWVNESLPSDVTVQAAVWSILVPAVVFARGRNEHDRTDVLRGLGCPRDGGETASVTDGTATELRPSRPGVFEPDPAYCLVDGQGDRLRVRVRARIPPVADVNRRLVYRVRRRPHRPGPQDRWADGWAPGGAKAAGTILWDDRFSAAWLTAI